MSDGYGSKLSNLELEQIKRSIQPDGSHKPYMEPTHRALMGYKQQSIQENIK